MVSYGRTLVEQGPEEFGANHSLFHQNVDNQRVIGFGESAGKSTKISMTLLKNQSPSAD